MFCKQCGKNVENDSKFCEFCGASVEENVVKEFDNQNNKESRPLYKRKEFWIVMIILNIMAFIHTETQRSDAGGQSSELENYTFFIGSTEQNKDVVDFSYLDNQGDMLPVIVESITIEYPTASYIHCYFDLANISFSDIRDGQIAILAWDENGLPIKVQGLYQYTLEPTYILHGNFENFAANTSETIGFELRNTDIKYMMAIIYEYEDFEGNIWENPLQEHLDYEWAGKKLEDVPKYYYEFN